MDARRHQAETAASTTPTTTSETPAKPKRERGTTTDGVKAGQIFERLVALDEEEQAELAASPADIRRRFEERRTKLLAQAEPGVRVLVERMRAP